MDAEAIAEVIGNRGMDGKLGFESGQVANVVNRFLEFAAETRRQTAKNDPRLLHFRRHEIMGGRSGRGSRFIDGELKVDRLLLRLDVFGVNVTDESQGFAID